MPPCKNCQTMNLPSVRNFIKDVSSGGKTGTSLTLLAEIASQKLHNESRKFTADFSKTKKQQKNRLNATDSGKMTVQQLRTFSTTQMLKMFTTLEGDEIKRTFYYVCKFLPSCGAKLFSFGSEQKARHLMKQHLNKHLQYLEPDYVIQIPKKVPLKRPAKPLKKLTTRSKLVENEVVNNQKINCGTNVPKDAEWNLDHDYHTSVAAKKVKEEYISDQFDSISDDNFSDNNVVVPHLVPVTFQPFDEVPDGFMSNISQEVEVKFEYIETSGECRVKNNVRPSVFEISKPRDKKPKGKAKFIGQSAEEREMAVEKIKSLRKGTDQLECQICQPPRMFTAMTTLISHYKSHAGIKPYECFLCKAVFTRQHSLNYHLLIHMNQTRFTCDVCGRKFRHPSHFKEHQRRHTGESPFHCPDCSIRFKTRNTYKRHLKTRHGKLLSQSGVLEKLSEEEFMRIRTNPKVSLKKRGGDLDKENSNNNNIPPKYKMMKVLKRGNIQQDVEVQGNDLSLNCIMEHNNASSIVVLSTGKGMKPPENLTDSFHAIVGEEILSL